MRFDEYRRHDATALAALVARGELTPAELLATARERLAAVQPSLNVLAAPLEALADAQLTRFAATPAAARGALAGVPLLLKDSSQDVAGVPTAYGSASMRRVVPPVHAHVTRRMLEAGALVFGKTNVPEFALKGISDSQAFGRVSNPWDVARNAGGSSGGAAAAVAAGVVPMATGNDGGGSLRIPASFCGLFALKPSRGRVSAGPLRSEVWFGASSDGVLSRSVRDTALALDLLCGAEPGDPFVTPPPPASFREAITRPPRRLRIAFSTASPIGTPVHPDMVAAVQATAKRLAALGHTVEEAAPPVDGAAVAQAFIHLYFGQVPAFVDFAKSQGARDDEFELLTRVMAALGRATSAGALTTHLVRWGEFGQALARFFATHDLWLTPATAGPAPRHGELDPPAALQGVLRALLATGLLGALARLGLLDGTVAQLARDNLTPYPFTQLANLTGVPAMSVPLAATRDGGPPGLPLGLQFVAPMGDEATLLQLAAELEADTPWFDRVPVLAG